MSNDIRIINDSEMTYSNGWEYRRVLPRHLIYFNHTSSVTHTQGAWAEYRLSGCERLRLFMGMEPSDGVIRVYLDGSAVADVDLTKITDNIAYDSGKLEWGEHLLKIEVLSQDKKVDIDYIECTGKAPEAYYIDNRNNAFVHFTFDFKNEPSASSRSGSVTYTDEPGEFMEVYFAGPFIRMYAPKGPKGGIAKVSLNGKDCGEIDFYSDKEEPASLVFEAGQLCSDGEKEHFSRLAVTATGSKRPEALGAEISADYFEIGEPSCVRTVMNRRSDEETDAMARYETTFTPPEEWKPVVPRGKVPVTGVKIGDGVFKDAMYKNIRYLKDSYKLPLWVDGKDGDRIWVDMLVASNEGRMLGGIGHTLRFIEDEELRKIAKEIIAAAERRQFTNYNGYLMPYESKNYRLWVHQAWPLVSRGEEKNYDRAMFTKGMLACGLAGFDEVYEMLRKFYDWFNSAEEYLPYMLMDSMAIQGSIAGPMVYHSPAGVPEDIVTTMKYYDLEWWMDFLKQRIPECIYRFTLNRPHNYLLTSICAFFEEYKATGEQKYLDACKGAWDIYHNYFQNIGGGISICEHFEVAPNSQLITNVPNSIYETCGNVFWIDLNHRLLQLEPDNELYASHVEQSIYNIVLACQGEDGKIRYFNHMNGIKHAPGRYNTCCEIQGTAAIGMLPQYIYMLDEEGAYVNLFASSGIDVNVGGNAFEIKMDTNFPYSDAVYITVNAAQKGRMKLRVRMPGWMPEQTEIYIDGKKAQTGEPGSYAVFDREWEGSSVISFKLPMAMKATKYKGANTVEGKDRYALEYGPLLMAVRGPLTSEGIGDNDPTILLPMSIDELLKNLVRRGEKLEFIIKGMDKYDVIPYFDVEQEEFSCFTVFEK